MVKGDIVLIRLLGKLGAIELTDLNNQLKILFDLP